MYESDDTTQYRRGLYGRSAKYRLSCINAVRRRRGQPEVSSLDEVQLRRAVQ